MDELFEDLRDATAYLRLEQKQFADMTAAEKALEKLRAGRLVNSLASDILDCTAYLGTDKKQFYELTIDELLLELLRAKARAVHTHFGHIGGRQTVASELLRKPSVPHQAA